MSLLLSGAESIASGQTSVPVRQRGQPVLLRRQRRRFAHRGPSGFAANLCYRLLALLDGLDLLRLFFRDRVERLRFGR